MIAYIAELVISAGIFIAVRLPLFKVTAHLPHQDSNMAIEEKTFTLSLMDNLGDRSEAFPVILTVLLVISFVLAILNMTSKAGRITEAAGHIAFALSIAAAIVFFFMGHTVLRTY